jgi:hypothetical protein
MYTKILTFLLLLGISTSKCFAQINWTLKDDRDGIKVFTSPVQNSKVKALRVECNFQANLSQIVSVLLDVKNCTEWVYHTVSCTLLKQVSPSELYYYSEVNLPWPAQNRDFVAHLTVSQNAATKVVTIDGPAVNGMMPTKEGVVRIFNSKGKWTITPLENRGIKVEYTLSVDPAGNIPAWMVNLVSSEAPIQSFKALRLQLKKSEYKNTSLSFINN